MNASDKLVELYRLWQDALARYGDTHVEADLFFELSRHIEEDPWLDNGGSRPRCSDCTSMCFQIRRRDRRD